MRSRILIRLALTTTAVALSAFALVPQHQALASGAHGAHDPCSHYHYSGDEDFLMWEQFCDDAVRELNHRYITTDATCGHLARYYFERLAHYCDRHCARCFDSDEGCTFPRSRVSSITRSARYKVGKCIWEAHMDYDSIYENARAQLESAGYNCLVQKLYTTYRHVSEETVRAQRHSNHCIAWAAASCHCRDIGDPPPGCGHDTNNDPPGGGGDPPGDQDGDGDGRG